MFDIIDFVSEYKHCQGSHLSIGRILVEIKLNHKTG